MLLKVYTRITASFRTDIALIFLIKCCSFLRVSIKAEVYYLKILKKKNKPPGNCAAIHIYQKTSSEIIALFLYCHSSLLEFKWHL